MWTRLHFTLHLSITYWLPWNPALQQNKAVATISLIDTLIAFSLVSGNTTSSLDDRDLKCFARRKDQQNRVRIIKRMIKSVAFPA